MSAQAPSINVATMAETAVNLFNVFIFILQLVFDGHLVVDTNHALDTASHGEGAVNLWLVVDKAAELDDAVTGHDGNVGAFDAVVSHQGGLDLGGDDAVVNLGADRGGRALEADAIADRHHPGHGAGNGQCMVNLVLVIDKAAQHHFALAGFDLEVEALDVDVVEQRRLD